MTYIKSIELENFKSFAGNTKFEFIKGFNIIAGANGSGKSKVVDALLFVFGESSKKEMRKIDRSGKSIFRVNGKASTREEIINLLSEIKMNTNNFNIVPQGKILNIATSTPEEKLSLIKSLAGIDIFEEKRDKAMSELKKVEENISTIQTVQNEKKKLMDELEKEKKRADEYKSLQYQLKELNSKVLTLKERKLRENYDNIKKELDGLIEETRSIEKQMDEFDKEVYRLNEEIQIINKEAGSEGEAKILEDERALQRASAEIDRLETDIKASKEQIHRINESLRSLQEEEDSANSNLKKELERVEEINRKLNESLIEKNNLEKEINDINKNLKFKHEAEERLNKLNDLIYQYKTALGNFPKILESQEKINQINLSIDKLKKDKDNLIIKVSNLKPRIDEIKSSIKKEQQIIALLNDTISTERSEMNTQNKSISVISRLKEQINGIFGTVETLFTIKNNDYADAIYSALGRRREFIVVDTVDTVNKSIEKIKELKLGMFSFIPLDKIVYQEVGKKPDEEGAVDYLINLVEFDPKFGPAIKFAFSDTLLVSDFNNAKRLIGKFRMVLPDGTVFEKTGTIYGGFLQSRNISDLIKRYNEHQEELNRYNKLLEELNSELMQLNADMSSSMISINSIDQQIKQLLNEKSEIERNILNLPKDESEAIKKLGEFEKERDEIIEKIKNISVLSDSEIRSKLDRLINNINELNLALSEARNRADSIRKFELANIEKRKQELERELKRFEDSIKEEEKKLEENNDLVNKLKDSLKRKSEHLDELRKRRDQLTSKINQLGKDKIDKSEHLRKLNEKINQYNVKLAEAKAKLDVVLEEMLKYEIKDVQISEDETLENLQKLLNTTQGKLNNFGPINELAANKYDEVMAQFNEYNDQLLKLNQEKEKIVNVIKDIDEKKLSAINETLGTLNQVLDYVFHSITNGSAMLKFENLEDPLNSGLEIYIDLPNKKIHSIHGLSGGELSIVALSLIIAISKYVNAQFYVLDEVDAALDQNNSARFSSLIKTYSEDTQFIVISHNETTLINADRAYGVMIDENGISKVVSIDISEKLNNLKS